MSKADPITQMVYRTCFRIILRMFKFRIRAIKIDNDLRVCISHKTPTTLTENYIFPILKVKHAQMSILNLIHFNTVGEKKDITEENEMDGYSNMSEDADSSSESNFPEHSKNQVVPISFESIVPSNSVCTSDDELVKMDTNREIRDEILNVLDNCAESTSRNQQSQSSNNKVICLLVDEGGTSKQKKCVVEYKEAKFPENKKFDEHISGKDIKAKPKVWNVLNMFSTFA